MGRLAVAVGSVITIGYNINAHIRRCAEHTLAMLVALTAGKEQL